MALELAFAIASTFVFLCINIYQLDREDKMQGKINSWLEMARGIHSVSQLKGTEEISRITNSLLVDLEKALRTNSFIKIFIGLSTLGLVILIGWLLSA